MDYTPVVIYQQSLNKQRIVITGLERANVTRIITTILQSYDRKFDHFDNGQLASMPGASIILIEANLTPEIQEYHHHVLLFTNLVEKDLVDAMKLADKTPKGGIVFYPEINSKLKSLENKERTDMQFVTYKELPHVIQEGKTFLISSTKEKFPINLKGDENLLALAVAKELLRKIGISSGQFYKAIATLE